MVPYYIMVAVPAILMMLFGRRSDKFSEEKKNKVVLLFFFGILLAILALRHETVGVDIKNYLGMFNKASSLSFKELFEFYEEEQGYYLLNKIISVFTMDKQIFLAIIAIISLVPVARLYIKNSENAMLTISIFLITSNFGILFY